MEKEEVVKAVNETLADFKKGLVNFASQEDINKAVEGITASVKESGVKMAEVQSKLDEIKAAAVAQGLAIAKFQTEQKNQEPVTFLSQLRENVKTLQEIQKGSSTRLNIKAAPNHLLANITSDNRGMFLPRIGDVQRKVPQIRSLLSNFSVSPDNHGVIYYTDQLAVVSGASGKAEGSAPATTSILTWSGYSKNLREVKDKVRISLKAAGDVEYMDAQLNKFVDRNMQLAVESLLYSGTDSSTSIDGIQTLSTTYTAAGAGDNNKVVSPNLMDLILAMKKAAGKDTAFNPTFALVSHEDYASLRWLKDDLGQYFISPFVQGPINIHGVTFIADSLVTADTMLVGDGMYSEVYSKGLNLQIGLDGNDFSEGYVTLLGVEELANIVRLCEAKAFQYVASIAAEIASMTKM